MITYRTGDHHGVTICVEGDGQICDRAGHDCARGHLVAVVVNGDQALAERICELLNAPCPTCSGPSRETVGMVCQTCGTDYGRGDA